MKRTIFTVLLAFAFGLGLALMASTSMAVHKNYDNTLTCGNCHTMHNSQGSASLGGSAGGSIILLRGVVTSRADIHNICLQCHASNGAQATATYGTDSHPAPKVYIDAKGGAGNSGVAGVLDSFAVVGAGGDFSGDLTGNSLGWTDVSADFLSKSHKLGAGNIIPPGGDQAVGAAGFSCINCHDPHGAYTASTATVNKYRNLRVSATGAGANAGVTLNTGIASYVGEAGGIFIPAGTGGNASAQTRVWPLYDNSAALTGTPASDSNKSNKYPSANASVLATGVVTADDGISKWCSQCHDNWHETIDVNKNMAVGSDWRRHPVNTALNVTLSGDGVSIVNAANYAGEIATFKALPVSKLTNDGVAYAVTSNLGGGFWGDTNSKVFCLSCHFAHGGPYYDNLRWSYTSAVAAGDQTGNSIASNVGCQLCHNR